MLPCSRRAVTLCERGTGPYIWVFSFSSLLIWAMLDLVPFILDQVSTIKTRAGLMWVVPGGDTSWHTGRVQFPPQLCGCFWHLGSLGVTKAGSCLLSPIPREMWAFLGSALLGGTTLVCSDNTAKPTTSLLLSSLLSHSRAHSGNFSRDTD